MVDFDNIIPCSPSTTSLEAVYGLAGGLGVRVRRLKVIKLALLEENTEIL